MTTERVQLVNKNVIPVEAPGRILVIPWGAVESKSGGFIVDAEACRAVVEAFAAHGVDLPIDFEHATLGGDYATPDGTAPAMGWIKSLAVEADVGVFANVEWTQRGAAFVSAKEYRYLSPVTLVRKSDKRVVALHSVALTNTPAIVGMVPIVNKDSNMISDDTINWARSFLGLPLTATPEEVSMELEKLAAQIRADLGLAADAKTEAVVSSMKAKLDELKALKTSHTAVCKALGAKDDAKGEELVVAINAAKAPAANDPDPTKFVPMSEFTSLKIRTEKSEAGLLAINREKFIAGGLSEGRISVANKDAWSKRFDANPADAEEAVKLIPEGTYPKDGVVIANKDGTPAGDGRIAVINKAKAEFKGEPKLEGITTCEAFVKDALRIANHAPTLTDDEKKLVVA